MNKFKEGVGATGIFKLKVFENGKLVEEYIDRNLIVTGGRDAISKLLGAGTSGKQITQISFGTNGADPVTGDTSITSEYKKAVEAVTYPSAESVEFEFLLDLAENNGVTIREFGLLCQDNTLFSRKVRAAIEKTVAIRLEGFWSINF